MLKKQATLLMAAAFLASLLPSESKAAAVADARISVRTAAPIAAFVGAGAPGIGALTELPPAAALTAAAAESAAGVPAAAQAALSKQDRSAARSTGKGSPQAARVRAGIRANLAALEGSSADHIDMAEAVSGDENKSARLLGLRAGITQTWLKKMRGGEKKLSPATLRLQDVVQRGGFSAVAFDKKIVDAHNDGYTLELTRGPITNQQYSGNCWIFAEMNKIRSALIASGRVPKTFEFSESYLYFYAMLEHSAKQMEKAIGFAIYRSGFPISDKDFMHGAAVELSKLQDGGWFEDVQFLVAKYGLVPMEAMPATMGSHWTPVLNEELKNSIAASMIELFHKTRGQMASRNQIGKTAQRIKEKAMSRAWKILTAHLGVPPEHFDFRENGKPEKSGLAKTRTAKIVRHTPQDFARKFVGYKPEDYVVISNYPNMPRGRFYRVGGSAIGAPRAGEKRFDKQFVNVTAQRLEELTVASLDSGRPVWFAAEIGKDVEYYKGIMHPDLYDRDPIYGFTAKEKKVKLSRSTATRLRVSGPSHAMAIVGYDRPDPKSAVVKFKVENSWGKGVGSKGVFHMYRPWMKNNVYEVVVHKSLLNKAELKAFKTEPKVIDEDDIL